MSLKAVDLLICKARRHRTRYFQFEKFSSSVKALLHKVVLKMHIKGDLHPNV